MVHYWTLDKNAITGHPCLALRAIREMTSDGIFV
jgi:hypothetical protein